MILREDVLRDLMAKKGILSVAALARKSKISKATIFRIIGRKVNPTGPIAMRLAKTLGTSVDSLFRPVS